MSKARLTSGPIGPNLLRMSIPLFFGMIGFALFNFFDSKFVGELGTNPLTALSYTVNTMLIMFSLAFGLGTGVTATISKAIGEGNELKVKRLTTDGLLLAVVLGLGLTAIGYPTIQPLFSAFGAGSDVMPFIFDYMELWYLGVPLIMIPMVGNSAIRAQGNTLIPAVIMGVSIVANILLDYAFIFGNWGFPRWEVFGASFATFVSRFLTLVAGLAFLNFKFKMLSFQGYSVKGMFANWWEILRIGIPSILTQLIIPLSIILVVGYASKFPNSKQLVSTLQISGRVDFFAMAVMVSLGTVLIPFIGQNLGAKKFDRINAALKISRIFALCWGVLMTVVFILFRHEFGPVFMDAGNPDPIFSNYMSEFYWVVPYSFVFRMFFVIDTNSLNAIQKPIFTGFLTFGQMLVLYVPLAMLFGNNFGYQGIFYAFVTATVFGAVAAWILNSKVLKFIIQKESL